MSAKLKKEEVQKLDAAQLQALVDEIGFLKARLAPEIDQLTKKSDLLKTQGVGVYTGTTFDATVSEVERTSLDMDEVRAKLQEKLGNFYERFIAKVTKSTVYKKLDVNARVLMRQTS